MKQVKVLFQILGISFLAIFSIYIIGGLFFYIIGESFEFKFILVLQNCGILISSLVIILILKKFDKETFSKFLKSTLKLRKKVIASGIIFITVFFSYYLIIILYSLLNKLDLTFQTFSWGDIGNFLMISLLGSLIMVIGEELIYRGFLLNIIVKKSGSLLTGLLISSLVFAIGHFQYDNIFDFILAFWGGIIIGFLYFNFDSIYAAILFHFGWNFSYSFFSFDNENPAIKIIFGNEINNSSDILELSILALITIWLSVYLLIKNSSKKRSEKK